MKPGDLVRVQSRYQDWFISLFMDKNGFVFKKLSHLPPHTCFLLLGFEEWSVGSNEIIAKVLIEDRVLYSNKNYLENFW